MTPGPGLEEDGPVVGVGEVEVGEVPEQVPPEVSSRMGGGWWPAWWWWRWWGGAGCWTTVTEEELEKETEAEGFEVPPLEERFTVAEVVRVLEAPLACGLMFTLKTSCGK